MPCPSPESVLSLFYDRPLGPADRPHLLHLAHCPSCRTALAFVATTSLRAPALTPPLDNRHLGASSPSSPLARRIALFRHRLDGGCDAVAAAAEGESRLLFRSVETAPRHRSWSAELQIVYPAGTRPALLVRMLPCHGPAPANGQFVLFGVAVTLRDGTAPLPPDVLTHPSGGVAFIASDGLETPGVPVLDGFD